MVQLVIIGEGHVTLYILGIWSCGVKHLEVSLVVPGNLVFKDGQLIRVLSQGIFLVALNVDEFVLDCHRSFGHQT